MSVEPIEPQDFQVGEIGDSLVLGARKKSQPKPQGKGLFMLLEHEECDLRSTSAARRFRDITDLISTSSFRAKSHQTMEGMIRQAHKD